MFYKVLRPIAKSFTADCATTVQVSLEQKNIFVPSVFWVTNLNNIHQSSKNCRVEKWISVVSSILSCSAEVKSEGIVDMRFNLVTFCQYLVGFRHEHIYLTKKCLYDLGNFHKA